MKFSMATVYHTEPVKVNVICNLVHWFDISK